MALIQDKKELVQAVQTIVLVDATIMTMLFPVERFHRTETIEYDASTVEGVAPGYNSFRNTADIIKKDGFDTVTLNPVNYNEAIDKSTIDANARQFGENVYGETAGMISPVQRSLLDGVAKLELRTQVGKKAIMYEALTTHKIAGGYQGVNGATDIAFNVPTTNKELLSNAGDNIYWSDTTNSKPLTNILRIYRAMKVKPSAIVMNDTTYSLFYASAEVITDMQNGKQNFYINKEADSSTVAFRAGRIIHMGIIIDVWVEPQQRKLASGAYTPFLANNFVVFASLNGEIHYGGIPVASNGSVENITAPFDVDEVIKIDPPQHKIVYRSAPLPVLKNGEEYYSLQVAV